MCNTTERPEALEAGTVKLTGTDAEAIIENVNLLLNNHSVYERMAKAHNPYGDGNACQRIVSSMCVFSPFTEEKTHKSHNERDLFVSLQKKFPKYVVILKKTLYLCCKIKKQ